MSKVKVTIAIIQTATIEVGDIPANLIRDLLRKNDGTFDGNWGLSDVAKNGGEWITESVEVEEVP